MCNRAERDDLVLSFSLCYLIASMSHDIIPDFNGDHMTLCLSVALLEDERRNNSQQTEESTKQIQYLQS